MHIKSKWKGVYDESLVTDTTSIPQHSRVSRKGQFIVGFVFGFIWMLLLSMVETRYELKIFVKGRASDTTHYSSLDQSQNQR